MTETKPMTLTMQDALHLAQAEANRVMGTIVGHALTDAGLSHSDGWVVGQRPDGSFRFERSVPDESVATAQAPAT